MGNDRKKRNRRRNKKQKIDSEEKIDNNNDDNNNNDNNNNINPLKDATEWLNSLNINDIISSNIFDNKDQYKVEFSSAQPFPHILIKNFMDDEFLKHLRDELKTEEFYFRTTDLNDFHQTQDLKSCTRPLVSKVRDILYSEDFRNIIKSITGIDVDPLSESVAMACATYSQTNHLLPHDDELEGRRIAYVLYLVDEDWSEKDGGCLELFSTDENCTPVKVVRRLVPQWNSLMFFEVSQKSWHMVSEVLSDRNRISIHGWFHGKPFDRPIPPAIIQPLPMENLIQQNISTDEILNRTYRRPQLQKQIQQQFLDESSIELVDFLRKDQYQLLMKELYDDELKWDNQVGPPHICQYSQILNSKSSTFMNKLQTYFKSTEFAKLIETLTGVEVCEGHCEYRKFMPGNYTIGHDKDIESQYAGIDIILSLLPIRSQWSYEFGGVQHYFDTIGSDLDHEPLLTLVPKPNTLSIVYRGEPGTCRFVKYINHKAPHPIIDLNCIYREVDDE